MLRTLITAALALVATQALAAPGALHRTDGEVAKREPVAGVRWVERAQLSSVADLRVAEAEASAAATEGRRPIVLTETNYYTFLPNDTLQLRLTLHPNGFTAPATMYLYRENRSTGARQFYSIPGGGLQPAGESRDLFGAAGSPVAIVVPELSDFVFFGSASDPSELSWGQNGALGGSITVPAGQTGLYQWVTEIRDATGNRVISRSNAMFSHIEESVTVQGVITQSTTWTANKRYVLRDFVGVANGVTLTIEPGTVIYGGDPRATLFIRTGAKINANGTVRRPIVFTSAQRVGNRSQRDWGSIVLLGRAPINEPGGTGILEGLPSTPDFSFGGTDPDDSSGVLRYVRLEFGGFEIEVNQEINALTAGGLGRGTTIEYIQVLHNKDDAFEFFGGTVNARYLLSVATADDGIDTDLGYSGSLQFVAIIKREASDENDSNFIETDGHPQQFTLTPKTSPNVYNVTGIGTGRTDLGHFGGVWRRGTAGKWRNLILTQSRRAPVTIRDDATFANGTSSDLTITNSLLHGSFADSAFAGSSDRPQQTRDFIFDPAKMNRNEDPMLGFGAPSLIKTFMPDLMPVSGSPALDVQYVATPPDDGFLIPVDFIGAVGPGHDWILTGWANFSND
jgi:hypothetical protein